MRLRSGAVDDAAAPGRVTPVDRDAIEAAAARIGAHVRATPVIEVEAELLSTPSPTVLKLELLQHAGSFKPRGAFNRVLSAGGVPEAGLVTASGGNHGAAVGHVARVLGLRAEVFVPSASPAAKRRRIEASGATLVVAGEIYDDAQAAADRRAAETGALLVHPYDHPAVVAGQGTLGRELMLQASFDTVLVAVGGGGLLAGVASWFRGDVRVVAVEPASIPAYARAVEAGEPVEVAVHGLAADSLGAKRIGAVPWACASPFVHEAVLVSDDDIRAAQRRLWDGLRVMAEPGGAASVAALLCGAYRPSPGERVAAIVCGGNVDPATVTGV
jgi:threonine dehydratase